MGHLSPFAKALVAALGVAATVVLVIVGHGAPAFIYLIISAATMLGVYVVPNGEVKTILADGVATVDDVREAVEAAQTGDVKDAESDLHRAELSANGALGGVQGIIKGVDPAFRPLPPLPVKEQKPQLPSEMPTPPQPVKPAPAPADEPQAAAPAPAPGIVDEKKVEEQKPKDEPPHEGSPGVIY